MTSLFPPRDSLVVTSRLGTGNSRTFFTGYMAKISQCLNDKKHLYLEFDCLELQVRDWPLVEEYLLQDAEEVLSGQEAGVVLLEVRDEVVQDEKGP